MDSIHRFKFTACVFIHQTHLLHTLNWVHTIFNHLHMIQMTMYTAWKIFQLDIGRSFCISLNSDFFFIQKPNFNHLTGEQAYKITNHFGTFSSILRIRSCFRMPNGHAQFLNSQPLHSKCSMHINVCVFCMHYLMTLCG